MNLCVDIADNIVYPLQVRNSKSQYKLDIGSESTTSAPKRMDRNKGASGSTKIIVPEYSKKCL